MKKTLIKEMAKSIALRLNEYYDIKSPGVEDTTYIYNWRWSMGEQKGVYFYAWDRRGQGYKIEIDVFVSKYTWDFDHVQLFINQYQVKNANELIAMLPVEIQLATSNTLKDISKEIGIDFSF